MQISRRAFLGVARKGQAGVLRPPWAQEEAAFQALCSRCGECIRVCPTRLLTVGGGGFPEAVFAPSRQTQGCTFCEQCLVSCKSGALSKTENRAPWALRAVINGDCLASRQVVCYTCSDACDVRAIRFQPLLGGMAIPLLDPDACNGCGACVSDCPTQAIHIQSFSNDSRSL